MFDARDWAYDGADNTWAIWKIPHNGIINETEKAKLFRANAKFGFWVAKVNIRDINHELGFVEFSAPKPPRYIRLINDEDVEYEL